MKFWPIKSGLLAIICLFTCFTSFGQSPTEYQLKAAFIYNFLQFVDWPSDSLRPDSPIVLGIVGDDPFGRDIEEAFRGKQINGRSVEIHRLKSTSQVRSCQVVFVSRSEHDRVGQVLQQIGDRSILSISDIDGFAAHGGILGFITEANKLRFEINLAAVRKCRLQVSSKLLRLAKIVGGKGT